MSYELGCSWIVEPTGLMNGYKVHYGALKYFKCPVCTKEWWHVISLWEDERLPTTEVIVLPVEYESRTRMHYVNSRIKKPVRARVKFIPAEVYKYAIGESLPRVLVEMTRDYPVKHVTYITAEEVREEQPDEKVCVQCLVKEIKEKDMKISKNLSIAKWDDVKHLNRVIAYTIGSKRTKTVGSYDVRGDCVIWKKEYVDFTIYQLTAWTYVKLSRQGDEFILNPGEYFIVDEYIWEVVEDENVV